MQLPDVKTQIHAVEEWYRESRVYEFGSYEQQRTKIYRCLGEIAEGVQKNDSLKVAAGIGRAIWTFVGLLHFSKALVGTEMAASTIEHAIEYKSPATHKHNQIHALMLNMSDMLWHTPKEGEFELYEFLTAINTLMISFADMAKSCGLEFDRVVYNGHYALIRTKGEMDELGMFIPEPSDFAGDILERPLVNEKLLSSDIQPSGDAVAKYITTAINNRMTMLFNELGYEILSRDLLAEMEAKVDSTLEKALEKHIRYSGMWRGLLFERQPRVSIVANGDTISAVFNEDLLYILTELKKGYPQPCNNILS